jgi:hypothetical protein
MKTLFYVVCMCCAVASYLLISCLQYMFFAEDSMYMWLGLQFTAGVVNGYVIGNSLANLLPSE